MSAALAERLRAGAKFKRFIALGDGFEVATRLHAKRSSAKVSE